MSSEVTPSDLVGSAAARRAIAGSLRVKEVLDRTIEEVSQPKGEFQRRIVTLALDRVDRLSRDPHRLGEIAPGSSRVPHGVRATRFSSTAREQNEAEPDEEQAGDEQPDRREP